MNSIVRPACCVAGLFAVLMLGFALPLDAAENAATATAPARPPATAPAPALTDLQKTAMDALDKALARYEALVNRDDDVKHQAAEKLALAGFKQRRAALAQTFDQGHYDDLRVDLNLEYQRLANWMAAPTTPPLPPKAQAATSAPPASTQPH